MKKARWMAVLLAGLLLLPSAVPVLAAQGGDSDLGLKGDVYRATDTATVKIYDGGSTQAMRPLGQVDVTIGGFTVRTDGNGEAVFDTLKSGTDYTDTIQLARDGYLSPATSELPQFTMTNGLTWAFTLQPDPDYHPGGGGGGGTKPSPSPTPTPTASPSPTPTATPTPTPSAKPAPEPTPSVSPTTPPTAQPSPTPGGSTPPTDQPGTPSARPTRNPGGDRPSPRPSAGTEQDPDGQPMDAPETSSQPLPPEVVERPTDPIQVVVPEGESTVTFDKKDIQESAASGRDQEITFAGAGPDGEDLTVTLEAFTTHDAALTENCDVAIEITKDGKIVVSLTTTLEGGLDTVVDVPHNIIALVRGEASAVRVLFQDEKGSTALERIFDEAFFANEKLDQDQDVQVKYDSKTGSGWIVITNQAPEHKDSMFCPKEVFEEAAAGDLGIRLCIYNPEDGEDLWYEWTFSPEDLAKVKAGADTDLFITGEPDEDDAILDLIDAKKNLVQYMVVNYHGKLPAPAQIMVKNQAGFQDGATVSLVYSNTQTGELETVYTDLSVKDGYVTYGIDHCSSFALTAPRPVSWLWLILLIAALLLVLIVILVLRRKKNSGSGGSKAARTILSSAGIGTSADVGAGGRRE